MISSKLIFIYVSLIFDVHAQLEYYLIPFFEKCGYDVRIILCDNSFNAHTNNIVTSDCEFHDHYRKNIGGTYDQSIIDQVCRLCSLDKVNFFDKIDRKKIISSTMLLSKYKHILEALTWKDRRLLCEEINLPNFKINDDHILSTLYTRYRISSLQEFSTLLLDQRELSDSLNASLRYYVSGLYSAIEIIAHYGKPAFFLFFNGRFGSMSGLKDALKSLNVPVLIHERGYIQGAFCISKDADPGDPFSSYEYWKDTYFSKSNSSNKTIYDSNLKKVSEYFKGKRSGKQINGFIFKGSKSSKTKNKSLPELINSSPYITFFTSSSDEISSYSKFAKFSTQAEILKALIKVSIKNNYQLIIRQHPNLGLIGRNREATQFLETFKTITSSFDHIYIINPESDVNTYELAASSELIFCPQTSLFFELIDLSYPVIQVKESPYSILINDPPAVSQLEELSVAELKEISA